MHKYKYSVYNKVCYPNTIALTSNQKYLDINDDIYFNSKVSMFQCPGTSDSNLKKNINSNICKTCSKK